MGKGGWRRGWRKEEWCCRGRCSFSPLPPKKKTKKSNACLLNPQWEQKRCCMEGCWHTSPAEAADKTKRLPWPSTITKFILKLPNMKSELPKNETVNMKRHMWPSVLAGCLWHKTDHLFLPRVRAAQSPACCSVLKTATPLRKIKLSNGYALRCCC